MHQQQGLQQAGFRRGPRVGIGTLAVAMAMAFIAGALVFALASRSSVTVPPAAVTATGPGPAIAQDVRAGSRRSGPHRSARQH